MLRVNNFSLCAITPSGARVKQGIVYMRVVSTIIFKGQNSIILMCSIMKELTFPRFISKPQGRKLAFHRENGPFDEELVFFFQRRQAIVALVCCVSLKKRLFWKCKMACIWMTIDINWNQQW